MALCFWETEMRLILFLTVMFLFFYSCENTESGNPCKDNPCKNNAIANKTLCKTVGNGFICDCQEGYREENGICLKVKDDKCINFECPSNSTCKEINEKPLCICNEGYFLEENKCIKSENKSFYKSWDNGLYYENSGNALCLDKDKNIIVAGYTAGKIVWSESEQKEVPTYADTMILKYNYDGKLLWKKFKHDDIYDNPIGVLTDDEGNIFVAGEKGNDEFSAFLTKYDSEGNKIWTKEWTCENGLLLWDLKKDDEGVFYLAGRTYSHFVNTSSMGGISDAFLIKVKDNGGSGKEIWLKQWGGEKMDEAKSILTKGNKIYVLTEKNGDTDIDNGSIKWDFSVTEFDKNGNLLKENDFMKDLVDTYLVDFESDDEGNFYIIGDTPKNFNGLENNGDNDIFILKLKNDYSLLWSKLIGTQYYDTANTMVLNEEGGIFIGGHSYGSFDGFVNLGEGIESDAFIMEIDKNNGDIKRTKMFFGSDKLTGESVAKIIMKNSDLIFTGVLDLNYIGDTQNIKSKGLLNKIIKKDYENY